MRSVAIVSACLVVAAVTATVSTSVSYASQPGSTLGEVFPVTSFGPAPTPAMIARESKELAVYTSQGISLQVASQALRLQGEVAKTGLVEKIIAALGDSYAGVWFEPAAAKFHVGVTSNASRLVAKRVAVQVGLSADVVESPVRSTTAALIAAQGGWSKKLARLLASGKATTGLDPPHNAVSVTVDSSVPSAERNALRRDAAESSVNVLVHVSHPAQQKDAAKKNCVSTFAEGSAYCEEAITAGVTIREAGAPLEPCTSGPMLIEGNETYMLTAGHCVGGTTPAIGSPVEVEITSKYTEGPSLEIGKEGTRYLNTERDMADVRVNRAAKNFTEPLPDPVPALIAEWVKKPKTPHLVGGVKEAAITVPKQAVCHEGQTSGEKCGEVTELNVEGGSEPTKHLVRTNACSEGGDSGGPFFFRVEPTGEILMMGLLTSGSGSCAMPPATSNFEPLLDLPEAATFGILSTYPRKELLTEANEVRPFAESTLLAEWLANGSVIAVALSTETTSEFLLEDQATLTGKAAILCKGIFVGTVGPNGEDSVTKLLNLAKEEVAALGGLALLGTGAGSDCVTVSGCAEGTAASPIEVWPKNLPWSTLLFLMEIGAFADLVKSMAFELLCLVLAVNAEDTCEASDIEFTIINDPLSGDASIPAQSGLPLANCTQGGNEKGVIATDAAAAIGLTGGELLTVSSE
jgi:hypothetical protein